METPSSTKSPTVSSIIYDGLVALVILAICTTWIIIFLFRPQPHYLARSRFTPPVVIRIEQHGPDRSAQILPGLQEVDRYVPLATTEDESADICLVITDTNRLAEYDSLHADHYFRVGFASYTQETLQQTPTCRGKVLIEVAGRDEYLTNIVVHELLHGLGLKSHSPDPNDIMYKFAGPRTTLSPADAARLKQLYH